ncbi:MAG: NAD(P)/FAD-dependent oxidoreductase [Dehalococcoidia bacterium]|nr:NAD(P)/FAD-dependent oxidoreductase [Dehalococcoidia bacterium]
MDKNYDVIIIGGGPNGLEAGAYLAKAGAKVLVLERRYEIGGGLATDELLLPGYSFNTHAIYMMMADYAPVYKDFDFQAYGCGHVRPSLQFAMPLSDGRCVKLYNDVESTCKSFAQFSKADADGYRKLYNLAKNCVDDFIAPATYAPAMPILDQVVKLQSSEVGRTIMEFSEKTARQIIHQYFEHDAIRAMLLYLTCMWGLPYDLEGMGYLVLLYLNRAANYQLCIGGSHTVASALGKIIHENGGMALGPQRIKRIIIKDKSARGVEMDDGTILEAKAVLSTIDPHQTFFNLVGEEHLEKEFIAKLKTWQWEKFSLMTMHLCLEEPPRFKAASSDPDLDKAFIYILGVDREEQVIAEFEALYKGELLEKPIFHASFPSVHDPSQAPAGRCSGLITRLAPYHLPSGKDTWYKMSFQETQAEKCLATLNQYASNMNEDTIWQYKLFTPLGMEDKFADMVQGSFKQGAYLPLQMGYQRPNDECSQNRTPIKNLYVGGSSCYPGGCVIWGPGYLAANVLAEDLAMKRWWPESEVVKKAREKGIL